MLASGLMWKGEPIEDLTRDELLEVVKRLAVQLRDLQERYVLTNDRNR